MGEKLSNSFWSVLGVIVGGIFTYGGIEDGGDNSRTIIGPLISLVNIWLLYRIWKDNDNS